VEAPQISIQELLSQLQNRVETLARENLELTQSQERNILWIAALEETSASRREGETEGEGEGEGPKYYY